MQQMNIAMEKLEGLVGFVQQVIHSILSLLCMAILNILSGLLHLPLQFFVHQIIHLEIQELDPFHGLTHKLYVLEVLSKKNTNIYNHYYFISTCQW